MLFRVTRRITLPYILTCHSRPNNNKSNWRSLPIKGSVESASKGKLHWLPLYFVWNSARYPVTSRFRTPSTSFNSTTSSRTICLNFAFTYSFSISAIRRYYRYLYTEFHPLAASRGWWRGCKRNDDSKSGKPWGRGGRSRESKGNKTHVYVIKWVFIAEGSEIRGKERMKSCHICFAAIKGDASRPK